MPFTVTAASAQPPVTVSELKAQAVVTVDIDDSLLERLSKAAVVYGENITGRKFVKATYELDLEAFPSGRIPLRPNLQNVESITYTDSDGVGQTLDTAEYKVKTTSLVGYVEPVSNWPYGVEDVLITFDAGWPVVESNPTTPEDIKHWLMVKVAGLYAQRENFIVASGRAVVAEMPRTFVDDMLSVYIVPGVGAGI